MQEYVEDGYNADDMENIFNQAARIVRTNRWEREVQYTSDGIRFAEPMCVRPARQWHEREQAKYPLHPIVRKALRMSRPDDWQQLLLQWPHESTSDTTRLAYTRDERSGEADRQVVTSIGKYLRAHFSKLPDHALRDLVALHSDSQCKLVHTTAEMLYHLHKGPRSCMVWGADDGRHPYETYDPNLGWHMAVRIYDGDTVGRALCNTDDEGHPYFVRTYKKDPHGGYSNADETLAAWLKSQGYIHYSEYPEGTRLKYISRGRDVEDFLAPYLDGGNQAVDVRTIDSTRYLVVDESGEYTCNQTDGTTEESGGEECADCGTRFNDGDGYWVGRYDDRHVCESCCEDSYRYGYGRHGNQYYIHEDDCEYVEGWDEYVDTNYLSDNDLVRLRNGDLCDRDDAVEIDDEWYANDDERICYDDYNDRYDMRENLVELEDGSMCAKEDAWMCAESGDWYNNSVDYELIDGKKVHPDNAPEDDEDGEPVSIGASPDQPAIVATPTTFYPYE
jgi:hypothetical protein